MLVFIVECTKIAVLPSNIIISSPFSLFLPSMQALKVIDYISCRYMVVFQYGSAVLFNVEDHEVESYLDIIRIYASGLLPEMRKDGMFPRNDSLLNSIQMIFSNVFFSSFSYIIPRNDV